MNTNAPAPRPSGRGILRMLGDLTEMTRGMLPPDAPLEDRQAIVGFAVLSFMRAAAEDPEWANAVVARVMASSDSVAQARIDNLTKFIREELFT